MAKRGLTKKQELFVQEYLKCDNASEAYRVAGSGLKSSGKEIAGRIVKGGISEGIFEELPQSIQEQIWQNAALDKQRMEGVPEAGATGSRTSCNTSVCLIRHHLRGAN